MESLFVPYVFPAEPYFIGLVGLVIVGLVVVRRQVAKRIHLRSKS
jgi:hypothetical protein